MTNLIILHDKSKNNKSASDDKKIQPIDLIETYAYGAINKIIHLKE